MITNLIKNEIENLIPLSIQISSKYQFIAQFSLVQFGLPKSTILLILLFL